MGVAEFGLLVLPTLVLYGILAVPSLATWADPSHALMSKATDPNAPETEPAEAEETETAGAHRA